MSSRLIRIYILIYILILFSLSYSFKPIKIHPTIVNTILNKEACIKPKRLYLALTPPSNQELSNSKRNPFECIKKVVSNFIYKTKLSKQAFFLFIYRLLQALKCFIDNLRNLSSMRYVYVLELVDGKYYVGSTQDLERRMIQHSDPKGGSLWTKRYPPIKPLIKPLEKYIVWGAKEAIQKETQVTCEYMWQYGIRNVRGAQLGFDHDFGEKDLPLLKATIGHSLSMKWEDAELWIVGQLQGEKKLPPTRSKTLKTPYYTQFSSSSSSSRRKNNRKNDVCYNCRQKGHWAADCPLPKKKGEKKK